MNATSSANGTEMIQRIRSHINVMLSGNAVVHYESAFRQRLAKLRLRCSKDHQLVFDIHHGVRAILKEKDHLTLRAYIDGLDSAIVTTLERYLKPGMVVVDVGANTGLYTLISAALVGDRGRVFAFEPIPSLAQRVEEHAKFNSLLNIEVFNLAVGATPGRAGLYLSKSGGDGWSSLYQWDCSSSQQIGVDIVTLDDWIQSYDINQIDLLKVDVEGAELDVLLGAHKALKEGIIKAIVVEFNQDTQKAAGRSILELRQSLIPYGFQWYCLPWDAHNCIPVSWASLDRLCDLIAIKRENL